MTQRNDRRSAAQRPQCHPAARAPGGRGRSGHLGPGRLYPGAAKISVAGGSANSTQYLVDGGYNNNLTGPGERIPFPTHWRSFAPERRARCPVRLSSGPPSTHRRSPAPILPRQSVRVLAQSQFNSLQFFEKVENGGLGRDDGLNRKPVRGHDRRPDPAKQVVLLLRQSGQKNPQPRPAHRPCSPRKCFAAIFAVLAPPGSPLRGLWGRRFVNIRSTRRCSIRCLSRSRARATARFRPSIPMGLVGTLSADRSSTEPQYVTRLDYQVNQSTKVFVP